MGRKYDINKGRDITQAKLIKRLGSREKYMEYILECRAVLLGTPLGKLLLGGDRELMNKHAAISDDIRFLDLIHDAYKLSTKERTYGRSPENDKDIKEGILPTIDPVA